MWSTEFIMNFVLLKMVKIPRQITWKNEEPETGRELQDDISNFKFMIDTLISNSSLIELIYVTSPGNESVAIRILNINWVSITPWSDEQEGSGAAFIWRTWTSSYYNEVNMIIRDAAVGQTSTLQQFYILWYMQAAYVIMCLHFIYHLKISYMFEETELIFDGVWMYR